MTRPAQLVITADDLGIDSRRDDGILEAHAARAITQASLLVGGKSAAAAAALARKQGLALGLHLDLTEMPSSAPRDEVASLLDSSGSKRGKHGLRAAVEIGEVQGAHVAREAHAQIDAFARLVGMPPTHLDGHQHVHAVPAIAQWLAPVLAARGVRTIRIPTQPEVRMSNPDALRFYRGVSDDGVKAREIYARFQIRSTDAFVGLDLSGPAFVAADVIAAVNARAGSKSIELMCHPGYRGEGVDDFNQSPDREHELKVLCGLPFSELIANGQVVLASFEQLDEREALR